MISQTTKQERVPVYEELVAKGSQYIPPPFQKIPEGWSDQPIVIPAEVENLPTDSQTDSNTNQTEAPFTPPRKRNHHDTNNDNIHGSNDNGGNDSQMPTSNGM